MAAIRLDPDPVAYLATFNDSYDTIIYDKGLAGRVMRQGHRLAEKPFPAAKHFPRVLEVGAGSAEHVHHVQHGYDEYILTDLNITLLNKRLPQDKPKVKAEGQDATKLTYADDSFDRVIATHILEHLKDPHTVIREWARVVKPGGVLTLLQPCDPGFLWSLGRSLGPRQSATKRGVAYDYWMAREHVNSLHNLISFLDYYFPKRKQAWWPLPAPSIDLNLFYVSHIQL